MSFAIESMPHRGVFIDTNLLVLLLVGSGDRPLISRHPRTGVFSPEDYDRLIDLIDEVDGFVTPNTLTETSNLLGTRDVRFPLLLRILIERSKEIVVSSADAVYNKAFSRLGPTDAVLLEVVSAERPLITADHELFSAALEKGEEAALYFRPLEQA